MTPIEAFEERSKAFLARSDALNAALRVERSRRNAANLVAYFAALGVVFVTWRYFDARWLFGCVVGFIVLRVIGNGVVNVWCAAEMRRIDERCPAPEPAQRQGKEQEKKA